MSEALRSIYLQNCKSLGVRPNSSLAEKLPNDVAGSNSFQDLDLRLNIVGVRGLIPVLEVVKAAPNLRTLNLTAQNINNDAIQPLCNVLASHPALTSVDLSGNPITLPAAKHVLTAVRSNPRIKALALKDTLIPPLAIQWIENALAVNNGGEPAAPSAVAKGAADSKLAATASADASAEAAPAPAAEQPAAEEASPKKAVGFAAFCFGGESDAGGGSEKEGSDAASGSDQEEVAEVDEAEEERQRNAASRVAGRRATVSGTSYSKEAAAGFQLPNHPKAPAVQEKLREVLWQLPILSHLDDREIETVVSAMKPNAFFPGEILYSKNSEDDQLYVVYAGAVRRERADGTIELVPPGGSFGETAVMTVGIREDAAFAANEGDLTTVAGTDAAALISEEEVKDSTRVYTIDRETYLHIVRTAAISRHELYDAFLQKVGFLQGITPAERSRLCEALSPVVFQPGQNLIEYGSVGKWFYIITEGTVEVVGRDKDDQSKRVKVCEFGEGECVGELEFIRKHLCVADCVAKTEVRCARMSRRHFQMVMGPVTDVLKRISEDPTGKYTYYQQRTADGALDEEPETAEAEGKKSQVVLPVSA